LTTLLESISSWRGAALEIIVIDAGSRDGTVDVLREWNSVIDYWVSEPDGGIYDAMNKGVAAASGEYILHLNAGDQLLRLPLEELTSCLTGGVDAACFAVDVAGFGIHRPRTGFMLHFVNTLHHQGTFYRLATHMGYDARYRIYGDFDLNQRMMKTRKRVRLFDLVVSRQVTVGVSGDRSTDAEQYVLIKRNFGRPYILLARVWRYLTPALLKVKRLLNR